MIHDAELVIPTHLLDLVPDDLDVTLYLVRWDRGAVQVGIMAPGFDSIEPVTIDPALSDADNEVRAVQMAIASFRVGLAEHRIDFQEHLSDADLVEAITAGRRRGDLDVDDLVAEAGRRLIELAPTPSVGGFRQH